MHKVYLTDYESSRGGGVLRARGTWGFLFGQSGTNMNVWRGIMPIYHVCCLTLAQNISVLLYNLLPKHCLLKKKKGRRQTVNNVFH